MSKSFVLLLVLVLIVASCLIMIQPAKADSRAITVIDTSELTNAINYAEDGDIVFVKRGTYDMPKNQTLVIGRSISLIGEDAQSTAIILHPPWVATGGFHLGSNGVEPDYAYDNPIKIQASNVTVSGFTLECDVGRSILTTGDRIQIVGNIFKTGLFVMGSHQNIAQNTFVHSDIQCYGSYNTIAGNIILGHSIVAGVTGSFNFICGNTVTDGYGIHLVTNGNIVFNNTVRNCSYGVAIASTDTSSDNVVCQNILTNNEIGLSVPSREKNNVLYANEVAYNKQGVVAVYWSPPTGVNTFYHNNFVGNARQVNTDSIMVLDGSTTVAAYHSGSFDDGKEGNYWSDYSGSDADGNGLGDSQYVIDANRSDHYPLMTLFNISNVTLELPEWTYPLPSQPPPALPSPSPSPSPIESPSPSISPTPSHSASASPSSSSTPQATSEPTQSAQPTTETFPTVPVAVASIATVVVAARLLVYFKKHKHEDGQA